MKPTIKKLKSTFDELSAKYKKGNAHTKSRQNRNVCVGGEPSSMSEGYLKQPPQVGTLSLQRQRTVQRRLLSVLQEVGGTGGRQMKAWVREQGRSFWGHEDGECEPKVSRLPCSGVHCVSGPHWGLARRCSNIID
jgi:hypothetical protein